MARRTQALSELEQQVMEQVWRRGPISSATCRDALHPVRPLRESTVRTIFNRLEAKGFVIHAVEGRTYLYRATQARDSVVMRAVKQVIDRFCDGSAEQLVVGMVENAVFSPAQLDRLAKKIAKRKAARR